jgi:hypothetical protein
MRSDGKLGWAGGVVAEKTVRARGGYYDMRNFRIYQMFKGRWQS